MDRKIGKGHVPVSLSNFSILDSSNSNVSLRILKFLYIFKNKFEINQPIVHSFSEFLHNLIYIFFVCLFNIFLLYFFSV